MLNAQQLVAGSPLLIGDGLISIDSAVRESGIPLEDMLREARNRGLELRLEASGWVGAELPSEALDFDTDGTLDLGCASGFPEARTKAALAAAKARGVVLGKTGPLNLRRNIEQRQQAARDMAERLSPLLRGMAGLTLREKAAQLTKIGVPPPRGGAWQHGQVRRVEERLKSRAGT